MDYKSYISITAVLAKGSHEEPYQRNEMLREALQLKPWITFKVPNDIKSVMMTTFSDAGFKKDKSRDYGQTDLVTGLGITTDSDHDIFHHIDWCSTKQRRVSYSSYVAEILAAADGDD